MPPQVVYRRVMNRLSPTQDKPASVDVTDAYMIIPASLSK